MKKIKITTSANTRQETWQVGWDYGHYVARRLADYDATYLGNPLATYDVEVEAMYPGTHQEWMLSIASRVEQAHRELKVA